jgi:hypothetical protein
MNENIGQQMGQVFGHVMTSCLQHQATLNGHPAMALAQAASRQADQRLHIGAPRVLVHVQRGEGWCPWWGDGSKL